MANREPETIGLDDFNIVFESTEEGVTERILMTVGELFEHLNTMGTAFLSDLRPIYLEERVRDEDSAPNEPQLPPEAQRETFLAEIGATAAEGGINYWAIVSDYCWYLPYLDGGSAKPGPHGGGNVSFTVEGLGECEDDFKPTTVTLVDIERGWKLFLASLPEGFNDTERLRKCDAANEDIHSMIDANYADQVIQYAVLGSHDYS